MVNIILIKGVTNTDTSYFYCENFVIPNKAMFSASKINRLNINTKIYEIRNTQIVKRNVKKNLLNK